MILELWLFTSLRPRPRTADASSCVHSRQHTDYFRAKRKYLRHSYVCGPVGSVISLYNKNIYHKKSRSSRTRSDFLHSHLGKKERNSFPFLFSCVGHLLPSFLVYFSLTWDSQDPLYLTNRIRCFLDNRSRCRSSDRIRNLNSTYLIRNPLNVPQTINIDEGITVYKLEP